MPKLTILVPDAEPMKIAFDGQEEVTIGRAEDNDIVLNHDSMSGHHAKLELVEDHYILVDLESTNGTFFDGAAANNDHLHNGSQIIFGQVPASYECDEPALEEDAEAEAEVEADSTTSSDFSDTTIGGGESSSHSIHAEAASQSLRPGGFANLSPLDQPVKKDAIGQSIMLVAVLALFAALATVVTAMIMKIS